MGKTFEQRFWKYVKRAGDTECWLWVGYTRVGYGTIGESVTGKLLLAHRVSYELHNGPIPPGLLVRHKCDVRGCVNPGHLELGTHTDNHRDAVVRGHRGVGERNGHAKLTADDVRDIREAVGVSVHTLAERYGVTYVNIQHILKRKTWKHVA